nr:hypothetical protein BaRGS_029262 [Batillaria attramentaria]
MTPEIKKLNLARNAIHLPSIALPRDLNLTRLRHLDLSGNRIQQVSPGLLANFLQLQVLDLSHNQLTHLLHDHDLFPQHTSRLLSLHLSHNALVLVHPTTFHHLHRLRDLDLSSNPGLGKTGVSHISFPEHLTSLDLRNCSLQQVHYCQLSQLHDLAMLRLSHNPLMCTCDLYNLHKWYR